MSLEVPLRSKDFLMLAFKTLDNCPLVSVVGDCLRVEYDAFLGEGDLLGWATVVSLQLNERPWLLEPFLEANCCGEGPFAR